MEFSELSIFPANATQIHESRRRTFPEWGRGLELEEYIKREEMLDTKPHAMDGKMVIWVLAPRSDPSTPNFLSACETYERNAVTSSRGCLAYGIASVFTPPQFRGKGYAKHLMRLLHFVLIPRSLLPPFPAAQWGEPPEVPPGMGMGIASALYSDVGANFYIKCGPGIGAQAEQKAWITHDAVGTVWNALDGGNSGEEEVEWIGSEEMDAVWKLDAALLKMEIQSAANRVETKTSFSFLPDAGVAQFLYERNKIFVPSTWEKNRWGAKIPPTTINRKLAFATWSLDPGRAGPSTLIITRLRADLDTFPLLLNAAKVVARELELDQVEVWNLPPKLAATGKKLGGITREREDHLPALAWFGEGEVQWCWNEKFSWC